MKATDAHEFLDSLNAGVFTNQLGKALSEVAGAVIDFSKTGEVTVTFKLSQIGQSTQVNCEHKLEYIQPTRRGKKREESTLSTPLHVTENGLELFAQAPTAQLFGKEDAPVKPREV